MTGHIAFAGLTDRGRVRQRNEDSWFGDAEQGLFVVSDGMGGRNGGYLASMLVVEALPWLLSQRAGGIHDSTDAEASRLVESVLCELSSTLHKESRRRPGLGGMGATVVMLLIDGARAIVGHLGDSRLYRLKHGQLALMTSDHSLGQYLADVQGLPADNRQLQRARSQLSRYVGMPAEPLPDVRCFKLDTNHRLLLCSDGLTRMLPDPQIGTLLVEHSHPQQASAALVEAANAAGGEDNVTVVVVDWLGHDDAGEDTRD